MSSWIYILKLSNDKYYIGSTRNLKQRIFDHQHGKSGYTSKYLPLELKYSCELKNYSEALKAERYIKSLKSKESIDLIIKSQTINIFR